MKPRSRLVLPAHGSRPDAKGSQSHLLRCLIVTPGDRDPDLIGGEVGVLGRRQGQLDRGAPAHAVGLAFDLPDLELQLGADPRELGARQQAGGGRGLGAG